MEVRVFSTAPNLPVLGYQMSIFRSFDAVDGTSDNMTPAKDDVVVDTATGIVGMLAKHSIGCYQIILIDKAGGHHRVPVTRLRKALPGERRQHLANS